MTALNKDIGNDWKERLKDLLYVFAKLCQHNGFTYYCSAGTALGAIRHGDIIPWDDDIDVVMPRPHYEAFVKLFTTKPPLPYRVVTAETQKNYYLPYAKLYDSRTTLLEVRHFRCVIGINLDIFPLDGICSDKQNAERLFNQYQRCFRRFQQATAHLSVQECFALVIHLRIKTLLRKIYYYTFGSLLRYKTLREMRAIEQSFDYDSSDNVINYVEYYGFNKGYFPKSWFGQGRNIVFGNKEVIIPIEAEKYLTRMYGDYLQLPPEEQRVSHHNCAYFNLDIHMNLKQVKAAIKQHITQR